MIIIRRRLKDGLESNCIIVAFFNVCCEFDWLPCCPWAFGSSTCHLSFGGQSRNLMRSYGKLLLHHGHNEHIKRGVEGPGWVISSGCAFSTSHLYFMSIGDRGLLVKSLCNHAIMWLEPRMMRSSVHHVAWLRCYRHVVVQTNRCTSVVTHNMCECSYDHSIAFVLSCHVLEIVIGKWPLWNVLLLGSEAPERGLPNQGRRDALKGASVWLGSCPFGHIFGLRSEVILMLGFTLLHDKDFIVVRLGCVMTLFLLVLTSL